MMSYIRSFMVVFHRLLNVWLCYKSLFVGLSYPIPGIRIDGLSVSVKCQGKIALNVIKSSAVNIPKTCWSIQCVTLLDGFLKPINGFFCIARYTDGIFKDCANVIEYNAFKLFASFVSLCY